MELNISPSPFAFSLPKERSDPPKRVIGANGQRETLVSTKLTYLSRIFFLICLHNSFEYFLNKKRTPKKIDCFFSFVTILKILISLKKKNE